jgi:hypothetical protein
VDHETVHQYRLFFSIRPSANIVFYQAVLGRAAGACQGERKSSPADRASIQGFVRHQHLHCYLTYSIFETADSDYIVSMRTVNSKIQDFQWLIQVSRVGFCGCRTLFQQLT